MRGWATRNGGYVRLRLTSAEKAEAKKGRVMEDWAVVIGCKTHY